MKSKSPKPFHLENSFSRFGNLTPYELQIIKAQEAYEVNVWDGSVYPFDDLKLQEEEHLGIEIESGVQVKGHRLG